MKTCRTCLYFSLANFCLYPDTDSGIYPATFADNYCKYYKKMTHEQRIDRLEQTLTKLKRR